MKSVLLVVSYEAGWTNHPSRNIVFACADMQLARGEALAEREARPSRGVGIYLLPLLTRVLERGTGPEMLMEYFPSKYGEAEPGIGADYCACQDLGWLIINAIVNPGTAKLVVRDEAGVRMEPRKVEVPDWLREQASLIRDLARAKGI
jgi:hypothetical protein